MKHCAILWDLDGTLLDTLADLRDATNYALRQFGCPPRSLAEIRRFVGNGARNQIRLSLPGREDDPDLDQVLACYKAYYNAHCQIKTGPYPGILAVLEQLKAQGYPMAVVSNKPDSAVKILCREHFGELISVAIGETPELARKPDPAMPHFAARAMGAAPEACIYVGDSEVDIRTARNAGMKCVSVLWGFRDEDVLAENGAEIFCRNVSDLPEILGKVEAEIRGK